MVRLTSLALLFLTACESAGPVHEVSLTPLEELECGSAEATIGFDTADGVSLVADLRPAPTPALGAVVLFHMRPPRYDRSCYPPSVREAIGDLGLTVLTVDRRGAGDSGGVAEDAFRGPGALRDMEASVRVLLDERLACPVDTSRLALVGASNGTTAVMDYTVAHDPALPHPTGLVWISPIEATENQHAIADFRDVLEALPMLWLSPTTEDFARDFVDEAPDGWTFVERGEMHGTNAFDGGELEAAELGDLLPFLERVTRPGE